MLAARSRRETHCAHCVHFIQTTATSQITKRALRAEQAAVLLVAPEITTSLQHRARMRQVLQRPIFARIGDRVYSDGNEFNPW